MHRVQNGVISASCTLHTHTCTHMHAHVHTDTHTSHYNALLEVSTIKGSDSSVILQCTEFIMTKCVLHAHCICAHTPVVILQCTEFKMTKCVLHAHCILAHTPVHTHAHMHADTHTHATFLAQLLSFTSIAGAVLTKEHLLTCHSFMFFCPSFWQTDRSIYLSKTKKSVF